MNNLINAIGRDKLKPSKGYQGFIDQFVGFMTRKEYLIVAKNSGQPLDIDINGGSGNELFSEGLY